MVDLGAGTGHLALPLAERGLEVTAVEPAKAMLDALAAEAAARSLRVSAVHAAAEATELPDGAFSLVLLADAMQWVDVELAGQEAARLRARGAVCAVVEAELGDSPFMRDLKVLFAQANPRGRLRSDRPVRQFIGLAVQHALPRVERFAHEVLLDEEAFAGTLRSLSFIGPALGPARLEELIEAARQLARLHGGARWRRELSLYWAGG